MTENKKVIDFLDEDPRIDDQRYYLLSYYIPPDLPEKTRILIKFRGAYKSTTKARERIKYLQEFDENNYFHIFTGEVGKWSNLLPKEQIDKLINDGEIDTFYQNEELNEFMKQHKKAKDDARKYLDFIKDEAKGNNIEATADNLKMYKLKLVEVKNEISLVKNRLIDLEKEQLRVETNIQKFSKDISLPETDNEIKEYYKKLEL